MLTAAAGAQVLALQQGTKLVGATSATTSTQGSAVAVSADGNTAIVGSSNNNESATNGGAVWIFVRANGVWSEQVSGHLSGGLASGQMGSAVAISSDGNTAIVGALGRNAYAGSATVMVRTGTTWATQGGALVGNSMGAGSQQGCSVAISADGNTVLVGASQDSNSGSTLVYTRSGTTWTQQQKLVPNDQTGYPQFGTSVSLSTDGNTAAVGGLSDNSTVGAVWIFTRSGSTWTQSGSKLPGPSPVGPNGSYMGGWVSISGDGKTVIGSAHQQNSLVGTTRVWINSAGTWTPQANLLPTGLSGISQINAVALSSDGNTVVIGGPGDTSNLGGAWIFTRSAGVWTQGPKVAVSGAIGTSLYLGTSVSISADGTGVLVGGGGDNNHAGAVWAFRLARPFVQQGAKLVGSGALGAAQQGYSVAVSSDGNTAIVGGWNDNSGTGAVWVWTRSGTIWTQQGSKLVGTGATPAGSANQGFSVALSSDGNTALVGGNYDNGGIGAVWVWTRSGGTWTQQGSKLTATGTVGTYVQQGQSVSLSSDGNTALVGGYGDNSGAGAVWVWTRSGSTWTQQSNKLVGTGGSPGAHQGISVSLSSDGNTALVGGAYDYVGTGALGAAWVWTRSGSTWTQQGSKLAGTGATINAQQGISVSLSSDGNTALVGGNIDNAYAGAVWVWTRSGAVWTQQGSKLVGFDETGAARQGISVSLSSDGSTALIGGNIDNTSTGAVWIWTRSGTIWTQQGNKLVGTGKAGTPVYQGQSVSLSGDGNTVLVGGNYDNSQAGAVWPFAAGYVAPSFNTLRVILVN